MPVKLQIRRTSSQDLSQFSRLGIDALDSNSMRDETVRDIESSSNASSVDTSLDSNDSVVQEVAPIFTQQFSDTYI